MNIENNSADGRTLPILIGDNCAGITKQVIENVGKVLDGEWHKVQTQSTTEAQPAIASNTEAKAPHQRKLSLKQLLPGLVATQ